MNKMNKADLIDLITRCLEMEEEMFHSLNELLQTDLEKSGMPQEDIQRIRVILDQMHEDTVKHSDFDRKLITALKGKPEDE